jgi:hypothetical protein
MRIRLLDLGLSVEQQFHDLPYSAYLLSMAGWCAILTSSGQ